MHMLAATPLENMTPHRLTPNRVVAASACVAMANPLDGETLAAWLHRADGCRRVLIAAPGEPLAVALETLTPNLVIVDPRREADGLQAALRWQRRRTAARLLVLDPRPREAVLLALLRQAGASYLTRTAGEEALTAAIATILNRDERVFDPAFTPRLRRTPRGFELADLPTGSLSMLTPRETEVMRLLSLGHSVADCAENLKLSTSTIDNHRSRLMKKLGLHKAALLTRRAIRDGLIEP
ncbi:MAG: response regulator transcription factor [Planctomycetales bacterium]|nr:response regulator transcription factor [Planctomycetales bacterium]